MSDRPGKTDSVIKPPPRSGDAENNVTPWPRAAATQAASRPAGPLPATTTLFENSAVDNLKKASFLFPKYGL